ncbi:hypothetical protein F5880DRAFT_1610175 [Lentinula raphanica]|nr:hypothetical protein F5880DRAFT_1610175 [Lentinula raphanica]
MSLVSGRYIIHNGDNTVGRRSAEDLSFLPKQIVLTPRDQETNRVFEKTGNQENEYTIKSFGSPTAHIDGLVVALLTDYVPATQWIVEQIPQHGDNAYIILTPERELGWVAPDGVDEQTLNRGMRVNSLEIFELGDLDEVASRSVFPILSGLREIQMHMRNKPVPSLFLSKLLSTHSTFNELWLRLYPQLSYVHDTPAFISSFVQESQRQSFIEFFAFKHVGFRRDFIGQSSHEWYVMDLTLDTIPANTSLVEMLARLASSFPKLEKLTLDLNRHQGSYPINDLAPVFGHFSKSLGTLYLLGVNLRLEYRNTEFPPLIRTAGPTNADDAMLTRVETGLLWFASWVARETRNLNYIFTTDTVLRSGSQLRHGESWCILGSFPVKSGNRDIVGSIQRTIGARRLVSEAEVETSMLPPGFLPTRISQA